MIREQIATGFGDMFCKFNPLCGTAKLVGKGVKNVAGAGGEKIAETVSGAFQEGIEWLAMALFNFAIGIMQDIWELISATTTPNTGADYVYEWAGLLFGIALPVTVLFLALQVVYVLATQRSVAGMGMAVMQAGIAVLGTAVSLPMVTLLVGIVDGLSDGLMDVTFGGMDQMASELSEGLAGWMTSSKSFEETAFAVVVVKSFGLGGALMAAIFLGMVIAFGSFMVWGALLIRAMLLTVVAVVAPIAIMGVAFGPTKGWARKWVSAAMALIFTKLGVVVVFGLGVSALANMSFEKGSAGAAIGQLFAGALMLILAAFAPVACFKFFDFLGEQAVSGYDGSAAAAPAVAANALSSPAGMIKQLSNLFGSKSGDSGSGGPSPTSPSPTQTTKASDQGGSSSSPSTKPGGSSVGSESSGGGSESAVKPTGGNVPSGAGSSPSATGANSAGASSGATSGGAGATSGATAGASGGAAAAAGPAAVAVVGADAAKSAGAASVKATSNAVDEARGT